jgi:hypothetical protein
MSEYLAEHRLVVAWLLLVGLFAFAIFIDKYKWRR